LAEGSYRRGCTTQRSSSSPLRGRSLECPREGISGTGSPWWTSFELSRLSTRRSSRPWTGSRNKG